MKIVILDGHAVNPGDLSWEVFDQFGSVTVYEHTDDEDAIGRIGNAEIVLTNKTPITEAVLDACPCIRLICVLATGYNVVDFSPQGSKFVRARPVGKSIREKKLFINKNIDEALLNELRNQFGYIHPLKEKMKEYPSPDLLDSTDYAHMGVMKILENKTRFTIL